MNGSVEDTGVGLSPEADDERFMLADVAQLYYVDDLTQQQIARQIGVSRSNVSRLLKEARERGVIEIRVHHPLQTVPDLQRDLREQLGLHDCIVLAAATPRDGPRVVPSEIAPRLGALAARYLQERIGDQTVIGVGWGSTVYHVVTSGYLHRKVGVSVVQLMGSVGGETPDIDGALIAGRLGRILGGPVYYLPAPMVVTDASVRAGLMRDQHIRQTLEMARRAEGLVVSVGAVGPASGIYRAGYLNDDDLAYIRGQGAVGDVCGAYFKQDGSPCSLELGERTIAVSGDVMRGVPLRVGVGWGPAKALPSVGAVRAGLVNVLITDETAATEILRIIAREKLESPVIDELS